jgi:RNA polymerase sigma-70 factor, ECF subfamily
MTAPVRVGPQHAGSQDGQPFLTAFSPTFPPAERRKFLSFLSSALRGNLFVASGEYGQEPRRRSPPEMEPSPSTDDELYQRMRDGDEDAFMTIYRQQQPPIFRFARQMTGSDALAEDVTQEVFMALMEDHGRFDPARGSLRAYLLGMARHKVLKLLAKERLTAAADETETVVAARDEIARQEAGRTLDRALEALPAAFREVIVLCELEGLTYEEAAAAVGVPVGTIRSRLHRGRALLLGLLAPEAPPSAGCESEGGCRKAEAGS